MRATAVRRSLLILALVAGQWLGFAHGFKHVGAAPDAVCAMCVAAHGLDDALPAAPPPVVFAAAAHETPRLAVRQPAAQALAADPPIRGPPVLLA